MTGLSRNFQGFFVSILLSSMVMDFFFYKESKSKKKIFFCVGGWVGGKRE